MSTNSAAARLSNFILLLRDVPRGARFYREGLRLPTLVDNETFAQFLLAPNVTLDLKAAHSEAQCTPGYSPFMTFRVDDMDTVIPRLLHLGAALDGAIRYNAYGKTAAVRSPDGHMVGLYEPAGLPEDGDIALAAAKAAESRMNPLDKADPNST